MKLKALVIEDEKYEREALSLMLHYNFSYITQVDEADNGLKALKLYKETDYNLVFVDISMPGIDGLETIRRLRAMKKDPVFIITSAHDSFFYVKEALSLQVSEYLLKPINLSELKIVMQRIFTSLNTKHRFMKDPFINTLERECFDENGYNASILKVYLDYRNYHPKQFLAICANSSLPTPEMKTKLTDLINPIPFICNIKENELLFLLFFNQNNNNETLEKFTTKIKALTKTIHIGVGVPVNNLSLIADTVESARFALKCTKTESRVFLFSFLQEGNQKINPDEISKETIKAIRDEDFTKIKGSVYSFFSLLKQYNLIISELKKHIYHYYLKVSSDFAGEFELSPLTVKQIMQINCIENIEITQQLIINEFIEISQNIKFSERSTQNMLIIQITDFIDKNYNQNLGLNDIAQSFGISGFYICRLMKRYLNKTYTDYLTNVRISKACDLLKQNKLSVKEIAFQVGFNSQSYFSKVFKKNTGVSPTDYYDSLKHHS